MLHGGWRLSFDLRHWLFLGERLHRCIIPSCALILPRGFWHPGWIEGELPLGAWRLHPYAAAAAKLLQSCLTLCDPIDGSPPGSPVSGILQARTLEWVAISFSNAWNWKVKVKSLSHVWLFVTPWTAAYQDPVSMGFSRQEYWSGVPLPSPHPCVNRHIQIGASEMSRLPLAKHV